MDQVVRDKFLVFDFDGTLADTYLLGIEIYNELAPNYGMKPLQYIDIEELRSLNMKQLIKRAGIPFWRVPQAVTVIQKALRSRISEVPIFPGIKEVILELKSAGYQLALLSSNREENIKKFLQLNDLEVFEYLCCGISLWGKHKAILNFMKDHNLDRSQVIYIGDEVRDIRASRKAKVKIVSVTWGFNTKAILEKEKPDLIADNVVDLLRIVQL